MDTFFNWPSTLVVVGATLLCAVVIGVFAVIGRRASILMKLGLRNVPRRPARAGLIVFGLMPRSSAHSWTVIDRPRHSTR